MICLMAMMGYETFDKGNFKKTLNFVSKVAFWVNRLHAYVV
jgi:hypothetical protein